MKAEIDKGRMMNQITLHVTVIERPSTRFRFWLGKKLIVLAVKVLGCRIKFHEMQDIEGRTK